MNDYSNAPTGLLDVVRVPKSTRQERVAYWLDVYGPLVRAGIVAVVIWWLLR